MKLKSISDIDREGLCIGCGFCASLVGGRSSLVERSDGFYHPFVDTDNPEIIKKIFEICPGLHCSFFGKMTTKHERIWGPIKQAKLGYATDDAIRWYGSSGGGITALISHMLDKGIIDAVIQVGQSRNDPLRTETYVNTKKEEVLHCASSRYCPSSPLIKIYNILSEPDTKFAFVGRPCDVSALRKYIRLNPYLQSRVVLLISFFCASTPSYRATELLLSKLNIKKEELDNFWYRGRGWPGRATAISKSGKTNSLSYMESWGDVLSNYAHFRCKICPDGVGFSADISFADAWETDRNGPVFHEKDGRNVILVRTENGMNALRRAVEDKYIITSDFNISELMKMQPSQADKRIIAGARLLALRLCALPYPKVKGYPIYRNLLQANFFTVTVNFLGTVRRRLFKKR